DGWESRHGERRDFARQLDRAELCIDFEGQRLVGPIEKMDVVANAPERMLRRVVVSPTRRRLVIALCGGHFIPPRCQVSGSRFQVAIRRVILLLTPDT